MAFSQSFLYKAIDKITPTLKRIEKITKKTAKSTAAAFKKSDKASKKATENIKKQSRAVKASARDWTKLGKKIKKAGKAMVSAGKTMTRRFTLPIIAGLTGAILVGARYEDSLLALSAITGLSVKKLEELQPAIFKTSEVFGISAANINKGMAKIGSEFPALLKMPKLLLEVAKSAAILAKASGDEFFQVGEDLAGIMKRGGIAAKDSLKIANIMAASSKAGSQNISLLTLALKESIVVAKDSKISFIDTAAALEIVGGNAFKGGRGGIQFRNVLLILEKQVNKKFKPSIVGLITALENLKKANMDPTKQMELFQRENIVTAKALINNIGELKKMKIAITGTNEAVEQARKRMSSTSEMVKRLLVTTENLFIKGFNKYKGGIKGFIKDLIGIVSKAGAWIQRNQTLTKTILIVAAVIGPIVIVLGSIASVIGSIGVIWGVLGPLLIANLPFMAGAMAALLPIMLQIVAAAIVWNAVFTFGKWLAGVTGLTEGVKNLWFWMTGVEKIKNKGLETDKKVARLQAFRLKLLNIAAIKDAQLRKEALISADVERQQLAAQGVISGKRSIEELVNQRKGLAGAGGVSGTLNKNTLDANININAPKGTVGSIKSKLKGEGNITIGQTLAGTT